MNALDAYRIQPTPFARLKHAYWLRSGTFTLLEKGVALLYGFGGALLLFRLLSPEEFGVWVLFLVVVSILEVGRIGLLQNALVKYLSEHEGDAQTAAINTASLVLNLVLSLFIAGLLHLLAAPLSRLLAAPDLETLLRIYSLTTLLLMPFFQFNYIQQANLHFKGIFLAQTAKGSLLFLFILFMCVSGGDLHVVQLAWVQTASALFASVVAWHCARPWLRFSRRLDKTWARRLFRFGKYVLGTNLSTQLLRNTDKLLLGALPTGGPAAVALYDAAMRVTNLTDLPTHSMASILYPQSARRRGDLEALKNLYEKAVGSILALMVPIVLIVECTAGWIIQVVAGEGYEASVPLLRLTILFGLFVPYAVQFGTLIDSSGRPRVNFLFTLVSLLCTAVLDYLFISRWGVAGAAFGTLLAYVIMFVAMQTYLYKVYGVRYWRPWVYMLEFQGDFIRFLVALMKGTATLAELRLLFKKEVPQPKEAASAEKELTQT